MSKRKFNPQKLYKLTRVVVIMVSILASLMTISIYNVLKTDNFYNPDKRCIKYSESNNAFLTCWNFTSKQRDRIKKEFYVFLRFAIFPPLVFFGSILLYKYLFPIQKE